LRIISAISRVRQHLSYTSYELNRLHILQYEEQICLSTGENFAQGDLLKVVQGILFTLKQQQKLRRLIDIDQ
jgi:hypothetical protein